MRDVKIDFTVEQIIPPRKTYRNASFNFRFLWLQTCDTVCSKEKESKGKAKCEFVMDKNDLIKTHVRWIAKEKHLRTKGETAKKGDHYFALRSGAVKVDFMWHLLTWSASLKNNSTAKPATESFIGHTPNVRTRTTKRWRRWLFMICRRKFLFNFFLYQKQTSSSSLKFWTQNARLTWNWSRCCGIQQQRGNRVDAIGTEVNSTSTLPQLPCHTINDCGVKSLFSTVFYFQITTPDDNWRWQRQRRRRRTETFTPVRAYDYGDKLGSYVATESSFVACFWQSLSWFYSIFIFAYSCVCVCGAVSWWIDVVDNRRIVITIAAF